MEEATTKKNPKNTLTQKHVCSMTEIGCGCIATKLSNTEKCVYLKKKEEVLLISRDT